MVDELISEPEVVKNVDAPGYGRAVAGGRKNAKAAAVGKRKLDAGVFGVGLQRIGLPNQLAFDLMANGDSRISATVGQTKTISRSRFGTPQED